MNPIQYEKFRIAHIFVAILLEIINVALGVSLLLPGFILGSAYRGLRSGFIFGRDINK